MVGDGVLFDTNILIDYLLGVEAALHEVRRSRERAISMITWMEVMAGTPPEHEDKTRAFLGIFLTLPVTATIAERAVVLRRDRRLKLPDAVILATAESGGYVLLTRNTRDFGEGDERVRIPYRL